MFYCSFISQPWQWGLTGVWCGGCSNSNLCAFAIHVNHSVQHLGQVGSRYALALSINKELQVTLQQKKSKIYNHCKTLDSTTVLYHYLVFTQKLAIKNNSKYCTSKILQTSFQNTNLQSIIPLYCTTISIKLKTTYQGCVELNTPEWFTFITFVPKNDTTGMC